eukprot:2114605-Rhodomonas_salina.1
MLALLLAPKLLALGVSPVPWPRVRLRNASVAESACPPPEETPPPPPSKHHWYQGRHVESNPPMTTSARVSVNADTHLRRTARTRARRPRR